MVGHRLDLLLDPVARGIEALSPEDALSLAGIDLPYETCLHEKAVAVIGIEKLPQEIDEQIGRILARNGDLPRCSGPDRRKIRHQIEKGDGGARVELLRRRGGHLHAQIGGMVENPVNHPVDTLTSNAQDPAPESRSPAKAGREAHRASG